MRRRRLSTDPRLLWNAPPIPARQPRPAEPLCSMRKDGHQIDAELRGHGEYGWEVQALKGQRVLRGDDGSICASRRSRMEMKYRAELIARDWQLVAVV